MPSHFKRRVSYGVHLWSGESITKLYSSEESSSHFMRRVPSPPSLFLAKRVQRNIPLLAKPVNPQRLERFLARVLDRSGDHLALTLWQLPTWTRLDGSLDLGTVPPQDRVGHDPQMGDLVWIWCWLDLRPGREHQERIYLEVERHSLGEDQKPGVRELLEALKELQAELASQAGSEGSL